MMKLNQTYRRIATPILFLLGIFGAVKVEAIVVNMSSFLGLKSGDDVLYVNDIVSEATGNWFKKGLRIGERGRTGNVYINSTMLNDAVVGGKAQALIVGDDLRVDGSLFRGTAPKPSSDTQPLKLNDNVRVFGELEVDGAAEIDGFSTFKRMITANDDVSVADDLRTKDLFVSGATDFSGPVDFSGTTVSGLARPFDAMVDDGGDGDYTTIEGALFAGKTCLLMKNGTYTPTTDIAIPTGGCLIGESPENTVIDWNGASNQILVKGISTVQTVEQIRLERFSVRESNDPAGAIYLENVGNARVRDLTIGANTTIGLQLKNVSLSVIESNRITVNSGDGIYLSDGNYRNIFTSNVIYSNTGDGIQMDGSTGDTDSMYNVVGNNVIYKNSAHGIYLRAADFTTITGNAITGNTLNGVKIDVLETDGATNNVVSANQLGGNTASGLSDGGTATVTSGNAT